MGKPTTLADQIYRQTFTKEWRELDSSLWIRKAITEARRFVLDDEMSALMTDLAYAGLIDKATVPKTPEIERQAVSFVESIRQSARLPHKATWIEFNMAARVARREELFDTGWLGGPPPPKCGWLMQQHPSIETAFMAIECSSTTFSADGSDTGEPGVSPLAYVWSSESDGILPWKPLGNKEAWNSTWMTGFTCYKSKRADVTVAPWVSKDAIASGAYDTMMASRWYTKQFSSDLRYLWAFLATINDIPTRREDVRPSKGFVARGSYRKFLEHQTIHLTVPMAEARRIAERAKAERRRAHEVRGHWRKDWRHPGERLWIREHQRGDAGLGFVTHDYEVTKGK